MKKLTLGFMLFALAAATMFSSCKKDDDDDDNEDIGSKVSTLSASWNGGSFSSSLAGFKTNSPSDAGSTKLFSASDGTTTILATEKGKQLAVTIKGTTTGTYKLEVSAENAVTNALISILSGEDVESAVKNSVSAQTEAMVIYRATGESEGGSTYYFSTSAEVKFDKTLVVYATGDFKATMRNKAGDTFEIQDGKFKIFGI
ncbi:MAG: hypothetical protein IKR94_11635 [Bacteroidales bacterium]|nr:hypothetical protein [Bacteroidales bacterium]